MAQAATPWGAAELVEELTLAQRAGEKRFASVVQLLEIKGERLVRFAYTTGGSARRGPVTLRARDLARLRAGLAERPGLSEGSRAQAAVSTRSRAESTSEPRISTPSVEPEPSSGSTACSGCGIRPKTFPRSLTTPAIAPTEPFGLRS